MNPETIAAILAIVAFIAAVVALLFPGVRDAVTRFTSRNQDRIIAFACGLVAVIVVQVALAGVGVLSLSLSPGRLGAQTPQTCAGGTSDDFSTGFLHPQWQAVHVGLNGPATYGFGSNILYITAPSHVDLWPGTKFDAPRLLQNVRGNFTLQVEVSLSRSVYFTSPPQDQLGYRGAGLLVWQDEATLLRLEQGWRGQPDVEYSDSSQFTTTMFPTDDESLILRLVRTGNMFAASWSGDGTTFHTLGTHTIDFASNVQVGLDVVNAMNETATAQFQNFRCT